MNRTLMDDANPLERVRFSWRIQKTVALIYLEVDGLCEGHGVCINDKGLILTAFHIFQDHRGLIYVVFPKGGSFQRFVAEIVRSDRKFDLALLLVKRENHDFKFRFARFAADISLGQDVHLIFSNDGLNFEYSDGTIAFEKRKRNSVPESKSGNISFIANDTYLSQAHNLHGTPGCSGAPVFDSKGRIVGVYSFSYVRMDFLVHLSVVRDFGELQINEDVCE